MKYKWSAFRSDTGTFYAQTIINNQIVMMSNFLLRPAPGVIIDHIDRNPLNNRRLNLRLATRQENNWNRRPNRNCSSRFKGVGRVNRWTRAKNPWWASIARDGRSHYLGRFLTEEAAARAYDAKARELFGEFAYLNFPEEEL